MDTNIEKILERNYQIKTRMKIIRTKALHFFTVEKIKSWRAGAFMNAVIFISSRDKVWLMFTDVT